MKEVKTLDWRHRGRSARYEQITQVARNENTVCSRRVGNRQELIAPRITTTRRGQEALLKVSCAALPTSVESELFGTTKGPHRRNATKKALRARRRATSPRRIAS